MNGEQLTISGLAVMFASALLAIIRDYFKKSVDRQERMIELLSDMKDDRDRDRVTARHRHRQILSVLKGDITPIETKLPLRPDEDELPSKSETEYIFTPRKSRSKTPVPR